MEHAIYTDCRIIINNFVNNQNPRFESFCVQWKALMFQHIYSAQSSTTEILQTTTTVMHVAKRILCQEDYDDKEMLRRIGGLYLLYAIYFKQPTKQFVKIDVGLKDWERIRKFVGQLAMDNADVDNPATDEPRYVFWKLYAENAFRFCAHDFDVGLENLVDYDKVREKPAERDTSIDGWIEHVNLLQEMEDFPTINSMMPALTTLEDGYNEMKELLVKEGGRSDENVISNRQALPPTSIFKDIEEVFQNIDEILGNQGTRAKRHKKQHVHKDHDTIKNLKRKGFAVTRTKDGLQIKAATSSTDDRRNCSEQDGRTKGRKPCRMSAKTVFAEELPKEILADLMGDGSKHADEDEILDQEEFIPN